MTSRYIDTIFLIKPLSKGVVRGDNSCFFEKFSNNNEKVHYSYQYRDIPFHNYVTEKSHNSERGVIAPKKPYSEKIVRVNNHGRIRR